MRPAAALLLLVPSLAAADRVTVKGTVLEGTVKSLSAKEVVMETVYGKGELKIPTADVEAIETDAPFRVYQADAPAVAGPVVGVTPDALTLAREGGATAEIPFDRVQAAPRTAPEDANWLTRRKVEAPWWSGSFDVAFSATESTTDTSALALGFSATRERGPDRLKLGASYLRGTSQDDFTGAGEDGREEITASEVRGFVRPEHDFTDRVFGFASLEGEHDGVEALSVRLIPKLGLGYFVLKTDDWRISVDEGIAFVYEKFYDGTRNDYVALALGAEADLKLPWLGARWTTRLDYLPSIVDPADDYRLRAESALLIPLVKQLSFKASVVDDYNAQPADDTASNSLSTLLGLSLIY
jgi:putative salt-induced outer membrane protein YdiY